MSDKSLDQTGLAETVSRTNEWYRRREQDPAIITAWGPFQEETVQYCCQQYRYLAKFLRNRNIASLEHMRVLDVGCGTGRNVRAFLDYGADPQQVYGLEIRDSVLEVGKRLSPHLHLQVFDGINIPFEDSSFDFVTQYYVVSSVIAPSLRKQLTAEMWRVVAPKGFLFWWDHPTTRGPTAKDQGHPIDLKELFPGIPCEEQQVAWMPSPNECIRWVRGARFLRPLLRMLGQKPAFRGALLGPK